MPNITLDVYLVTLFSFADSLLTCGSGVVCSGGGACCALMVMSVVGAGGGVWGFGGGGVSGL